MRWGSRPASQQRGQASARLGGPVERRATPSRAPTSGRSLPMCRTGVWRLQAVAKRPTAGFRGRTALARSRPDTTPRQRRPYTQVRTAGRAPPAPVRADVDQHRPRLQGCESLRPRADACGPGNGWRLAAAGRPWIYVLEVGGRVSWIRCRVSTSCPSGRKIGAAGRGGLGTGCRKSAAARRTLRLAETAVRQAWDDRLLETEAVLPVGRTTSVLGLAGVGRIDAAGER